MAFNCSIMLQERLFSQSFQNVTAAVSAIQQYNTDTGCVVAV